MLLLAHVQDFACQPPIEAPKAQFMPPVKGRLPKVGLGLR